MAKKQTDDLVDAGSEYSFPASDPPSFMGGAVAGPPPEDGEPPHEPVIQELSDPDEAKPTPPNATDMRGSHNTEAEERIRRRAYEIWEGEGRSGDAQDHWLRAEREIRGESRIDQGQESEDTSRPPSEDAGKMVEQVRVAMDARNARSKQTKRAGVTGKKEAAKNTGSNKGEPRRSK